MVLVREWHRLRANHVDLSLIRRLQNQVTQEQEPEHDPDRAEDRQPRQGVGTRMKDLRHSIDSRSTHNPHVTRRGERTP